MFTIKNAIYDSTKRIWLCKLFLLVISKNKYPSMNSRVPAKHKLVINVSLKATRIPLAINNININNE